MLRARRRMLSWFSVVVVAAFVLVATSASADGPPALVKDIAPGSTNSDPGGLVDRNGTLFFRANNGNATNGQELWKSDGTEAGTVLVKDINPGTGSSSTGRFVVVSGTLYFAADDGTNGQELWKSDGTEAGTVLVKDINPGVNGSDIQQLTSVGGTLFFRANDGTNGNELWKSDGTNAGTVLVKETRTNGSGDPEFLTDVNGTLFFSANDNDNDRELYKSDGTAAGTVLVKNINPAPGESGSNPGGLVNVNGTVFFHANDGTNGSELWKSDGTQAGTVLVKNINPGDSSNPGGDVNMNGTLFFHANDGTNGRELWKSNGTEAGTVLVKDINPGGGDSDPQDDLKVVAGTLFLRANDGTNGSELWKSDGTETGTVLVKDIRPGGTGSVPDIVRADGLANVPGAVFFSADDGTTGRELWRSDGTAAGTVLVQDIRPGIGNADIDRWTTVGGTLFFRANDGTTGQELWSIRLDSDGDNIFDEVDEQPGTFSNRFSDVPRGGATSGQVVAVPAGTPPTVQVVDHPNPARGVRVTVSGGSGTCTAPATPCPRAEIRLDGKVSVTRLRSPGTYTVTDPEATFRLETEIDGPAEVEVLGSVVVIEANEQATITERDNDGNGTVDEATITPGEGDEITVNGQPTTQPVVVSGAPTCNGLAATIFVGANGKIVGGPDNGKPYLGKLRGTTAANVIVGTGGVDDIDAKAGNDTVCGGGGNDVLEAAGGHDRLLGEDGNDRLLAGGGNDTLTGGLGADRFEGGAGRDTATDFTPTQGDTKTGVEVF